MNVSGRLDRYVRRNLSGELSGDLILSLEQFDEAQLDGQDPERVGAAIVILIHHGTTVDAALGLAQRDWRDLLMAAGLGGKNWRETLAAFLESGESAIPG